MERRIIINMGLGKRGKNREEGQVAILFALVFTFMFVVFAFVVDFGHLINNKINLQLAADSAAYAGAAWQARLLNQIGAVNYHMRQDVKEMALRLQVSHVRHNRNFPRGNEFINGDNQAPRGYFPFMCSQAHGYVARSGLRYNPQVNLCRNAAPEVGGLPPIAIPPVYAGFDPLTTALRTALLRIQGAAIQECRAAATDNRRLAEHMATIFARRSQFHAGQIRELAAFLNEMAVDDPMTSDHPALQTAFESARRNLTFSNTENFKMSVLPPSGNEYIELSEQRMNARILFYDFQASGNSCIGQPSFVTMNDMLAGLHKRPEVLTYFTVKLEAQPTMLFMPQPWVDAAFPVIEAVSTAKPFGSRIGPQPAVDILVPVPNPINQNPQLNFKFTPRDQLGIMSAKRMAYFDALSPFNNVGRPDGNVESGWPFLNRSDQQRAPLQAIRTPTIFDSLFFSVFPDPGENINADYAEPEFARTLYPDYLEAAAPNNTLIDLPQPETAPYLPLSSRNRGQGWIQINANAIGTNSGYSTYAEEDLGSHSVTGSSALPGIQGREAEFGFATRDVIHSAWAPPDSPGRIGYSVKFVGLEAVQRGIRVRRQDGGVSTIDNPPTGDPNLPNILH